MRRTPLVIAALFVCLSCSVGMASAGEKWPGIDEAVVKKIAGEHGREARRSLIDTGEGDMQLFVFLVAGAVGGFVAGYCWRGLLEGRRKGKDEL